MMSLVGNSSNDKGVNSSIFLFILLVQQLIIDLQVQLLFYNVTTSWLAWGDPIVFSDIVRDL